MEHIIRSGQWTEGPTGPAILQENLTIVLNSRRSYKIEENTTVEQEQAIGLYVTDPGVQVEPGANQMDLANFNTAYLVLRSGSKVILDRLYLSTIKKWNDQGKAFPLHLNDKIQFSRSELFIENTAGLDDTKRCQLQVAYLEVKRD